MATSQNLNQLSCRDMRNVLVEKGIVPDIDFSGREDLTVWYLRECEPPTAPADDVHKNS